MAAGGVVEAFDEQGFDLLMYELKAFILSGPLAFILISWSAYWHSRSVIRFQGHLFSCFVLSRSFAKSRTIFLSIS